MAKADPLEQTPHPVTDSHSAAVIAEPTAAHFDEAAVVPATASVSAEAQISKLEVAVPAATEAAVGFAPVPVVSRMKRDSGKLAQAATPAAVSGRHIG